MPSITPGRITALWLILNVVCRHNDLKKRTLIKIASNTSMRGGGLPFEDGLEIGFLSGFLSLDREKINITKTGHKVVSLWNKEEPNHEVIREILLPIILRWTPSWTAFIDRSIEEMIIAIPERWREVLRHAGLLSFPLSDQVKDWWKKLQENIGILEENFLKKIGDAGEMLSIFFERKRLIQDNLNKLARKVEWVSKENDDLGFDISSYFGTLNTGGKNPNDKLVIEVKSSTSEATKIFRLYLTRNEWDAAEINSSCYFFHLWRGVNFKGDKPQGDGPLILPAIAIDKYVPQDRHKRGKWMKCRIELNLKEIESYIICTDQH